MNPDIKVLPDADAIAQAAAERIVQAAGEAIELRNIFTLALAGGSTPKTLYELLASDSFRHEVDWARVEIFFGDERSVPPGHPDSNYRMAERAMLARLQIPGDNIYRMAGELDPVEAAEQYDQMLREKFTDQGMDMILLGMGDDGHTASLFPGTEALGETERLCVANHVPKLRTSRITLTAPFINRARHVLFLVAGAGKKDRVEEVLEGRPDSDRLPVHLIRPESGQLTWLIDAAAAGMMEE